VSGRRRHTFDEFIHRKLIPLGENVNIKIIQIVLDVWKTFSDEL
jgi:hypothetical protein